MSEPAELNHFPSGHAGGSIQDDAAPRAGAASRRAPSTADAERQVALYDTPRDAGYRVPVDDAGQPAADPGTTDRPVDAAVPEGRTAGMVTVGVDESTEQVQESAGSTGAEPAGNADAADPGWGGVANESVDQWLDETINGSVSAAAEAACWADFEPDADGQRVATVPPAGQAADDRIAWPGTPGAEAEPPAQTLQSGGDMVDGQSVDEPPTADHETVASRPTGHPAAQGPAPSGHVTRGHIADDGTDSTAGHAEPAAQPRSEPPADHASSPESGQKPVDDKVAKTKPDQPGAEPHSAPIFALQMEDVAATAGEFVRDAGDFARQAWQRIGRFASGARGETMPQDESNDGPQLTRPAGSRGIERLVVRSVGRRVRLVNDPRVATISADGPHTLRRQGAILEISTEGEVGLNFDAFSMVRPPRSVDDLRTLGLGKELVVRVNPAILVDARVTGSRLTTVGLPYLGRVRVTAGGLSMSGVFEVAEALIQVGGAVLTGPLSGGRSTVHVESGNLSVRLDADASVTVRAQTQLGMISWPGDTRGEVTEYAVGDGRGRLELGVVMGRAVVRLASE